MAEVCLPLPMVQFIQLRQHLLAMKITIEIEIPGLEYSDPGDSERDYPDSASDSIGELDKGLTESNDRIDAIEARLGPNDKRLYEPTFESDCEDSEL